tara:strand:+ start:900 stop:1304 length:405 start_codon:yes stop_codon:yes gene_type:complete
MITVDPVPTLVLATFRQGLAVGNQGGMAVPDCGDFLLQRRNRTTAWLTIIVPVCGIERLEIPRQTFVALSHRLGEFGFGILPRTASRLRLNTPKTRGLQVKPIDKGFNEPNHIVRSDTAVHELRQKQELGPITA